MYSLLFLAVASLLLSIVFTPLVRITAQGLGLVDHPDSSRKPDYRPIPRVGGIAVMLAFVLSYFLWWLTPLTGIWTIQQNLSLILKLIPAVALVFLIGTLRRPLAPPRLAEILRPNPRRRHRLFRRRPRHGFCSADFTQWWWTLPATVFWLVACTNAINLIDGVDGLAAGLSLVATLSMLLGAALSHNVLLAFATVPLAGCLIGFLRYNFNPASVYLGDSGSLFIGFLLGCYGVLSSQKSATILGMTAPLIALAIPLLDTTLAIVRRFLRRQPIFTADRGHIHHRLLDRGLTPRRTALLLYGLGAIAAIFSLAMANNHLEIPVILVFGVVTWLGIQRLGFVEFDTAGRLILRGAFRGLLTSHIVLDSLKSRLTAAASTEDCWQILESSYRDLGFCRIHMRFSGCSYLHRLLRLAHPLLAHRNPPPRLRPHRARPRLQHRDNPTSLAALADTLRQTLISRYALAASATASSS